MKSKLITTGCIIAIMITMTACGNQAQAETVEPTTVVETTIQETAAEPTTEESTAEPTEESYSGQRDNGDAFVKLDLPTLSTGKTFDEIAAMQYEIVYNSWSKSSDEEKEVLGREGLMDQMGSLIDFTDQEKNEVADYILSKSPIPAQESSKQESKSSTQPTQSQSKPKETQASVQPQPTQSEVQPTEQASNDNTEMDEAAKERLRKIEEMENKAGHSLVNNVDSSEWGASDAGKDAEIVVGGGN